ncbi:hypothetical protein [Rubinisphaera sp. JC750]|uniref:hypothetical protein n=1 Tax=Rubinisphaera sp. JC750 TaxID=2898658 RepID=UPI001F365A56|nr:hypothetical protein [Rubinisphaera sp. JC750]
MIQITKPLFRLGQVVSTPAALELLSAKGIIPFELLSRHSSGDWGDLTSEDKEANDHALAHGDRIFSSYSVGKGKVWVITEADRSSTCILLPEEY